ncbi:hypothetical protein EOD39_20851 [Acipenser ruthenus]|uniref:PML C-terminal domain-containing protein n=1 Tax=Acipenser ruthenus TaxID=7906 RepID=A0A444UUC0_ACIRT|nr:hypothetical protein EOD39_20851 [Acipenser ruthenus]
MTLKASTPIKIKRERQDDEEIKPGTYLAFELPPKHPYTPSLEKPGVSPVHPNFGQETADDSLLDYNDDECEETQSVPLVEGKAISKTTAQKLARLGFNFEKMKRSHLQNPSEGLRQFLEPLKEELKNSMFTKTVDKICDFFKIEQ